VGSNKEVSVLEGGRWVGYFLYFPFLLLGLPRSTDYKFWYI